MTEKADPMTVARTIYQERFPKADVLLLAGSVVRDEATAHSDLDLVVVYSHTEYAYHESMLVQGWKVEVFVHDPQTVAYFLELDAAKGIPALAQMISEGRAIPGETVLSTQLKSLVDAHLAAGPPSLTTTEVKHRRYMISDCVDDLRCPRTKGEAIATGAQLYGALADYWFRSQNRWSASGKAIPRVFGKDDGDIGILFSDAFVRLFLHNEVGPAIALAEYILKPLGGFHFEGFRMDAPADWRKK